MSNLLNQEDSLVLIIDVQEKLVNMLGDNKVALTTQKMAKTASTMNMPVVISEQYPKGLGITVLNVIDELDNYKKLEKTSFSILKEEGFKELLKSYNKKQIIVVGIEAHICVHQSVKELLNEGYEVFVLKDGIGSRKEEELNLGIEMMQKNGATITSFEIALFELLGSSKHPNFKELQALIK